MITGAALARVRHVPAALAALAALALVAHASRARADDDQHRLRLDDEFRRFDTVEYVLAGSVLVASGVVKWTLDSTASANLRGGILFDDAVREAVRLRTRSARELTAEISDWTWYGVQAWPVIESLFVPLALDDLNADVAWQLTAINFESYAVAGILIALTHVLVGRERPSGFDCDLDDNYDALCRGRGRYASTLSGHTGMAFTGAALVCAHHQHLPLWGGDPWDGVACFSAVTAAMVTGILRMTSDRHFATDVLPSAALGVLAGYLLPMWLHYDPP